MWMMEDDGVSGILRDVLAKVKKTFQAFDLVGDVNQASIKKL